MTFENCSLIDFTIPSNIDKFRTNLESAYSSLTSEPLNVPILIDGKEFNSEEKIDSLDPSTEKVIAKVNLANTKQVEQALDILSSGQDTWRLTPFSERCEIIDKLADLMEENRYELAAYITIEAGKPWKESDADVAEAIDFCRYYSQEMRRLGPVKQTAEVIGEHSTYFYQSRGITAVISPWNFPLAIPCGMTVAALVTGNVVALKPAEQTSLIAYKFIQLLIAAGVPSDVISFLPGKGEDIGAALVDNPKVHMIVFTGSRAVGLQIIREAAKVHPGQEHIKKVVAELGGKNAIIVDEDADLDEAIKGILYSSFAFAGQKCSACSRVIAVGDAYETLKQRLIAASSDLIVGSAHDSGVYSGPVIDKETQKRISAQQQQAAEEFNCVFQGQTPNDGFFVPISLYTDTPLDSWLWTDEIFGPVLAVVQAKDFDEAIQIANNSEYALTGGIFSRSPENIHKATKEFRVGNLYINRSCTGAIVCRHPFGGFKLSGIGSKAGGPDYLLQFMEPRTVTENTMRRGFTPDLTT